MQIIERECIQNFSSYDQLEGQVSGRGQNDWVVPWADLMMVMFVLFVVLFVYASTHQNVKVLFSSQSADRAQATSTLDPLIGLIGQISGKVDGHGSQQLVSVAENQVLYRSRTDGVSVVREGRDRIRITLRGELFFLKGNETLAPDAISYLQEIAEVVQLSSGTVHVIGYASVGEAADGFHLSTGRAADVARLLMAEFAIDPKRVVITGRGSYAPEFPNTSTANQAMNRRVEIIIAN